MKKSSPKYSVLELAIVSQGNSIKETLNHSLKLAQHAELHGYSRFWLAEHHNSENIGSSATAILIGYIAEGTKTIRVGSGGIMLPNHSPLIVAEQFGTLGALYPNRIDLGLGRAPGTDRETAQAIRSDFMMAAHSFPDDVMSIQQYFKIENSSSKIRATVAEGVDVPIYILGSSTDSAHLAAGKGLPYAFASHFASTHLLEAINIYREEFQSSPSLDKPHVMTGINVIIAETDDEAERMATSLLRMIVGVITGKRDYMQPPMDMTEELRDVSKHPAVQQMLKYSFIGNKNTVKEQVKTFIELTGADELIVVSHMFDPIDRLRSYELFAEIMKEL